MNDLTQSSSVSSSDDRASPLIYTLHAAATLEPAEELDRPAEVNCQPVAYFWADGIRAGRYVHPAGKFELHVDGARLDTWVRNFGRMKKAGVDVPVPVDHSPRARDNLGYVVDVRRDGDTLRLLHQFIGDDAIRLAARNKVSLGIDPEFRDGRGVMIGDCIVHSSLTPTPVVPGQEGFTPLSRGANSTVMFQLAPDGAFLEEYASFLGRRADALVGGGHITPACRDRIVRLFHPRDRPGVILLSRESGPSLADQLLDALEQNRALPLGERTGLQTLSRLIPGEESGVNPNLQSQMVRMASGQ